MRSLVPTGRSGRCCARRVRIRSIETDFLRAFEGPDPPVEPRDPVDSPAFVPGLYRAMGRAEGLALAAGRESPEAGDVLVALLWPALGFTPGFLHRLGVDRGALTRSLAACGVTIPPGKPEPLDLRPRRRLDVPFERLMEIVRELPPRMPEGTPFGFNLHHETRRAWIVVGEDVEAEPLVEEILSARAD